VPATRVQAVLRECFARWGLPERLRVDNGFPWGSWGDLPPDLALWILGLGVEMHWNRPRQPQENGVIERSQGTAKRWAEPFACVSVRQLQKALDRMDRIQREVYPVDANLSRLEVWPQLAHSGRTYTRQWEKRHWDLRRVVAHLSGYAVTRRISKNGRVTLYNRTHYVGCIHREQTVYVMLDPDEIQWVITDAEGRQLCRLPAKDLCRVKINHLDVSRKTPEYRRKLRHTAKLSRPN
jgi:transposase InsO family protein